MSLTHGVTAIYTQNLDAWQRRQRITTEKFLYWIVIFKFKPVELVWFRLVLHYKKKTHKINTSSTTLYIWIRLKPYHAPDGATHPRLLLAVKIRAHCMQYMAIESRATIDHPQSIGHLPCIGHSRRQWIWFTGYMWEHVMLANCVGSEYTWNMTHSTENKQEK